MSSFTHIILTRFNLQWNQPGRDDDWLEHRFDLFHRFCYPSVRGQTNQSFRWVVLFDADTPSRFIERVRAYESWERFRPYWINGIDQGEIDVAVRENVDPGATHLISSTLDNDDALAVSYVERVQAEFAGQAFEIVNFPTGYRLDIRSEKLYRCEIPHNPFVTLIERIRDGQPRSVYRCLPHSTIPDRFDDVRDVGDEPLWLQVVHERNLAATGLWGRPRVPIDSVAGRFALEYRPPASESRLAVQLERLRRRAESILMRPFGTRQRERAREWLARFR